MRGHAKGPFNAVGVNIANPVLRVQQQLHLTPGDILSVQIEASQTEPVLMKILSFVGVALTVGTNSLVVGNETNEAAYLAAADTTLGTPGFNTEKKFTLTSSTTLIAKLISSAVAASKALTISLIAAADTQTVTIGGVVYTFNTVLVNSANRVLIGADPTAMAANLAAAINAGTGSGVTYGAGTVANPSVTAVAAAGVVTVTAKAAGTAGNSINIAETLTNGAWAGGATTLSGGGAADSSGSVWLFIDA